MKIAAASLLDEHGPQLISPKREPQLAFSGQQRVEQIRRIGTDVDPQLSAPASCVRGGRDVHGEWRAGPPIWSIPCTRWLHVHRNRCRRRRGVGRYMGDERSATSVDARGRRRRAGVSRRPT